MALPSPRPSRSITQPQWPLDTSWPPEPDKDGRPPPRTAALDKPFAEVLRAVSNRKREQKDTPRDLLRLPLHLRPILRGRRLALALALAPQALPGLLLSGLTPRNHRRWLLLYDPKRGPAESRCSRRCCALVLRTGQLRLGKRLRSLCTPPIPATIQEGLLCCCTALVSSRSAQSALLQVNILFTA